MGSPGISQHLRRFYVPPHDIGQGRAVLRGQDARHCGATLRMKPGDAVVLLDGEGAEYQGRIQEMMRDEVHVRILGSCRPDTDSPARLILAQALLRSEKMKWVVQKATELGAASVLPLLTARCVARPTEGGAAWVERYRRIAVEAMKQCGRATLPELPPPVEFGRFLETVPPDTDRILLWEEQGRPLNEILREIPPERGIVVAVGPEGGFQSDEADLARAKGFHWADLGARVLRAETAALVALAVLQYERGDLGRRSGPGCPWKEAS